MTPASGQSGTKRRTVDRELEGGRDGAGGGERSGMWSDSSITSCGHLAAACVFKLTSRRLYQLGSRADVQKSEQ